ncbi:Hypothetical protein FKW44_001053 [Caligus rogercresseyi]|uniref:Uncharacterized protein n=1 Tax=Caligus rogercresseyi TaxID=217165 RepID=A0A7T8KIA7_CALRO|nr:Hypothetical protein FKW44_001053 [Caligus rogercresseyi]
MDSESDRRDFEDRKDASYGEEPDFSDPDDFVDDIQTKSSWKIFWIKSPRSPTAWTP